MNRTIKFRVWDNLERIWLATKGFTSIAFDIHGNFYPYGTGKSNLEWPDRFVVQQFTGLNDSKGTSIYEGDILEFKGGGEFTRGKNSPVIWVSCLGGNDWSGWYCQAAGYSGRYEEGEVIGNIFESPELLN